MQDPFAALWQQSALQHVCKPPPARAVLTFIKAIVHSPHPLPLPHRDVAAGPEVDQIGGLRPPEADNQSPLCCQQEAPRLRHEARDCLCLAAPALLPIFRRFSTLARLVLGRLRLGAIVGLPLATALSLLALL